ncbi:MAG: hypothetical protein HY820_17320 [Acidobacteria bacterium]|nr:hypothetical protein [Acidobacteriota bacterium]
MKRYLPLPFLAVLVAAQPPPVALRPYHQAEREFHASAAIAVPATLKSGLRTAKASDGAVWTATDSGVWRETSAGPTEDRKRYFASRRWLPDDKALHLSPDATGGMWIATETGVSHIFFRNWTLEQKTVPFEQRIETRHNRFGMVASSHLLKAGDLASNQAVSSDNDGLWTAMYGAGECFRYAVTKSPDALRLAKRSVEVLLKLEEVTGRPGYPARSYIVPGEPRPRDGAWFWQPSGAVYWKGDTSSDEVVGYYYLHSLAFDLLPDAELRRKIVGTITRITDLILDSGLTLTGVHGMPTWWGRWDREYFQSERGKGDSPLNALEILSFLKSAHHITGNPRYAREYTRLANQESYAKITTQYRELLEGPINFSDEELAMLSFYPLMQYEKDPKLRVIYRQALEQWWKNMPRQKNPLWSFIYSASDPSARPNLNDAVWTLQRTPLDLVTWTVKNSHRTDIQWEPSQDRFRQRQSVTLLPMDERPVMKWNGNPFRVDGGNGGHGEDDGAFFLLPYWMGRWHRLLKGQ